MKYRFSIFLLGIFIANTLVDILCWMKGIPLKMSYFIVLVNDVTFCLLMLVTILQERRIKELKEKIKELNELLEFDTYKYCSF